jgi:alpha-glucosidase
VNEGPASSVSLVPPAYEPIGPADHVEPQSDGLRLHAGLLTVDITVLAADLVRVGLFADGRPVEYESAAVVKRDWHAEGVTVTQTGGAWRVETPALTVHAAMTPVRLRFEDRAGRRFAEDDPELGMGVVRDAALAAGLPGRGLGPSARVYKRHAPTARYFGCGERTGGLDKTGTYQLFWNVDPPFGHTPSLNNLYSSVPFVLVLDQGRAWGLFLDNPGRVEFDLAREHPGRAWFGTQCGDLVYYVFAGPTPAAVLERYTELTGRTPMPPLWALGYHQSSWNYEDAEHIRALAREFRARDIPCDALYLDIDYMEGYRVFTWSRERFPDPKGLIADLHAQGFRVVTIVDPGVKVDEGYPVYREGRAGGHFCRTASGEEYRNVVWPGLCAFPDFTSARTRDWWAGLHRALLEAGVDGIWCDMNEPAVFVPHHSTFPVDVVHPGDGRPRLHGEVHNLYGMLMAQAARAACETFRPTARPFVISRAGYAGLQRVALQWTGDNSSWWEHLWMSVPQLLNMGLSGIAWAGVDIGGFWGECDGELLTRWVECAVFQPFCRNHSAKGVRRQEPWAFGEPYEGLIRRLLKLRQRLIPYLYTVFEECHRTGAPIVRPLFYEFPEDDRARTADAEFLLGGALLIAPITRPGVEHRHVYLPAGTWVHLWSGQRWDGPAHILAHAPLGVPAIYLRANTPLPLWPEMGHVGERTPDPLTWLLCPAPGAGSFTLYEDMGDGYAHERGLFARTRVTCQTTSERVVVQIGPRVGAYRPARTRVELDVRGLAAPPAAVLVDDRPVADWSFADGRLLLALPDRVEGQTVALQLIDAGLSDGSASA